MKYLEQYERRALSGVVVQILFTKRQQHLQLVCVNLVERHLSQQNCNTLKNISFNSGFKKEIINEHRDLVVFASKFDGHVKIHYLEIDTFSYELTAHPGPNL